MGSALLLNIPPPDNIGSHLAFPLAGGLFVFMGIFCPLFIIRRVLRLTRIVKAQQPEKTLLRFREEEWSDSTDLYVHILAGPLQGEHKVQHPRKWKDEDVEKPVKGNVYKDGTQLAAVEYEGRWFWRF